MKYAEGNTRRCRLLQLLYHIIFMCPYNDSNYNMRQWNSGGANNKLDDYIIQ